MKPPLPLAGLLLLLLAAGPAGCIAKDPTASADDDTTADDCVEGASVLEPFYYEGQAWCGRPMPGDATCFDCHFCAKDPDAALSNTHYVCNYCHSGPGGEILEGHGDSCGCAGLTCDEIPDPFPCQECHTDGCNGYVSAALQRYNCLYCHTGTGAPPEDVPPR